MRGWIFPSPYFFCLPNSKWYAIIYTYNLVKRNGRIILDKLLDLFDTNNTELIGTQGYRRIIPKNQSKIAEIIGVDRKYLSKAIANLEENNIVKYESGMLIINPLVFNQNSIYDIRALQAFNIKQTSDIPTKKFTDNVIMKKADESTRSKIGF